MMCQTLGIARSSYYQSQYKTESKRFWCKKSSKLGHTDTTTLKKEHDQYGKPKFIQMETLSA